MLKGVLIASALGLGALLVPSGPAAAVPAVSKVETPSGVTEVGRRHHRWHGHRHHRRGWHRHSGFRFYIGPRRYYGGGRCAWLRHRAAVTGSPYWWRHYRRCRGW